MRVGAGKDHDGECESGEHFDEAGNRGVTEDRNHSEDTADPAQGAEEVDQVRRVQVIDVHGLSFLTSRIREARRRARSYTSSSLATSRAKALSARRRPR